MEVPQQVHEPITAPHSIQSELSVLGSMILDASTLDLAFELLEPADFYLPSHQDIFACMRHLKEKGAPVDSVSLTVELDSRGILQNVGGAAYIAELAVATPSSSNIEHYIEIVSHNSSRRQLMRAGNAMTKDASDNSKDIEQVMDDAERRIYEITMKRASDTLMPVTDIVNDAFFNLGELMNRKGRIIGVPTGFIDLDAKISGLKKSDLIIVAGRPAMGKTSLAINISQHAAIHAGHTVVIFSLEMSREQLVTRMFSTEAEIDMQSMLRGEITEDDLLVIAERAMEPLAGSRLFIDDSAAATVPEIRSKCRRLKAKQGLDLIVIDYLQLMRSARKADNRQLEVSEITRSLKVLARELDTPIILLSQLSRAPEQRKDRHEGHRPKLSDLRESGAIEQDADIVLLLYRDQVYNEEADNVAEVIIAKHRNGPTGVVRLCWLGEFTKFKNLAEDYQS